MHDVEALVAKSDKLAAVTRRFKCAVVCPLVQGFSLLPITDSFARELDDYPSETRPALRKPTRGLSDELHVLAIEASRDTPIAYISTFYFGGQGGQNALVWDKGSLRFSPATPGYDQSWPNSPISQALRTIGVVAEGCMDEFDTVNLGKHRETHRWAASVG
jgi:hypothetical protein